MADGFVVIEGIDELNRALRKAADKDVPKAVGRAHKRVGTEFIAQWLQPRPDPRAVGRGAGSAVRPSASKREVLLRVGGKHRAAEPARRPAGAEFPAVRGWGKRDARLRGPGGRFLDAPDRPDIRGSVEAHEDDLRALYLDEIWRELRDIGMELS